MAPVENESTRGELDGPQNPLAVPAFRYLWFNSLTFALVANALRFVYGWVALEGLDGSEATQGFVVFLLGVPGIFLLLPAGVWADRLNRRLMLMASQAGTMVVMAITAFMIATDNLSLGLIVVSALASGAVTAVGSPVRTSLVPELLPRRLLLPGIALSAVAMTLSLVVGSYSAQLVGNRFGFDGTFWYLGLLSAVGIALLIPMRPPTRTPTDADSVTMREAISQGFRFVAGEPALRVLFAMLGLAGFVMNALMFVTLQAFVKEELGRDPGDAGLLLAMVGIGLASSSLVVMRLGDLPNKGTLFLRAMMIGTITLSLMGRATEYWHLIVLTLILGLAGGFFINMNQSLIQANTPPELMGRVMGFYTIVQGGLTPVGALALGLLATQIGTANTLTFCAAGAFAAVAFTYLRATHLHELET